ncbi:MULTISPECIES: alpha/beta hydrolase [Klebsiella/Raoultella group]|uniref:alpha/beta hydrolase n=1 Tax=Klebsiella/Raoultella group TaxID=2890311 RepID=UPI0015A74F40|nr:MULTISPECIES: alpha/beta hydrolase [Klebsiella/Raoultella group]
MMNEELRKFLAEQNDGNHINFSSLDAIDFRSKFPKSFAEGNYRDKVNAISVEINLNGNEISARLYRPVGCDGKLPVLVYFHGGGFVIGSPSLSDSVCEGLSYCARCVVISVDYRLAPEYKFPVGLQDAFEALNWVYHNDVILGINSDLIAVGGNSAGGNFAAVLAQASYDVIPNLCHQLLLFPVLNCSFDSSSSRDYAEGYFLSKNMMKWFWDNYLPDDFDRYDPLISPLHAHQLKNVCSATIITAQYDILRDDAHSYAQKLKEAGVPVALRCWEDSIHDFILMPDKFSIANEAIVFAAERLKDSFTGKNLIAEK